MSLFTELYDFLFLGVVYRARGPRLTGGRTMCGPVGGIPGPGPAAQAPLPDRGTYGLFLKILKFETVPDIPDQLLDKTAHT